MSALSLRSRVWIGSIIGVALGLAGGTTVLLVERDRSVSFLAAERHDQVAKTLLELVEHGQLSLPATVRGISLRSATEREQVAGGATPGQGPEPLPKPTVDGARLWQLTNGSAVVVVATADAPGPRPPPFPWRALLLAAAIAGLTSAAMAYGTGRALRQIENAADAVDADSAPCLNAAETGPKEQRAVIRAFNRMQNRIQSQLRDRVHMAAAISHDMKTPLARILFRAEQIENHRLRSAIERDVESVRVMIDSTIAYVHAVAEDEPTSRTDLASLLSAIVDDSVDSGAVQLRFGNDLAVVPAGGLLVQGAPLSLKRALSNLVDNGIRYGSHVTVTARRVNDVVEIIIADSGPGLEAEDLARLGEPYFRGSRTRSQNTQGHGLGIAIAKRLIERGGGTLSFSQAIPKGVLAVVKLPAVRDEARQACE
jgi:signal transduction histidine kinase